MYKIHSRRNIKGIISAVLAIFLILSIFPYKAFADNSVLDEARQIIKTYYINDVPDSVLDSASTVEQMVEALNDPYSAYFTQDEYAKFVNSINNTFYGIGIHMDIIPEGVLVVSVIENSPAALAGLKEKDIITEADGHSLAGLSAEEAASYIKGEKGTTVHLKVKRGDKIYNYDIVRDEIVEPTVSGGMIGNAAYIDIASFGESTAADFGKKVDELSRNCPLGYIIDLRNNGGGYLTTALDIAGYFISGKPALIVQDKNGDKTTYFASQHKVIDKPVVFLINEYSASASEILTAAVKDYKKAIIVGTNSYGKGTVQSMFQLSDGSVLKITVDKFFSPLGNAIDKIGIAPDVNTNEDDALYAGYLLLSGNPGIRDKSGRVLVNISGFSFEIDLKTARLPEFWEAYSHIINVASKGDIYFGNSSEWIKASSDYINNKWKMYYPKYISMPSLSAVPVDKKFTISFSASVDASAIKDRDIELIDADTGERVKISFEKIDDQKILLVPETNLKEGGKYYLLINDTLRGKNNEAIKDGVLAEVTVK